MPKCFTEWTVLPHEDLQKPEDNLWYIEGILDGKVRRVMAIARMNDGRLIIHNGIALEDELMAEIEAFGTPSVLVVPNSFHRQDAAIYKQRYPQLQVVCPARARKRVGKIVGVQGDLDDAPSDDAVRLQHLDGCKKKEGVLLVRSAGGVTAVFNDMLMNYAEVQKGVMGFFIAPSGTLAVPRFARWFFVSDKRAFRSHLERIAADGLSRIIVSHGDVITQGSADRLRTAAAA
jgi:hypothetical protein